MWRRALADKKSETPSFREGKDSRGRGRRRGAGQWKDDQTSDSRYSSSASAGRATGRICEPACCGCVWKPSPKSIPLQLSDSGYPPLPLRALQYPHRQKPGKEGDFFTRGRVKINILSSQVSQHNICLVLSKRGGQAGMNQVPEGVSGLFLRGLYMTTARRGDIRDCKHGGGRQDTRHYTLMWSWNDSCCIKCSAVLKTGNRPGPNSGLSLLLLIIIIIFNFLLIDSMLILETGMF